MSQVNTNKQQQPTPVNQRTPNFVSFVVFCVELTLHKRKQRYSTQKHNRKRSQQQRGGHSREAAAGCQLQHIISTSSTSAGTSGGKGSSGQDKDPTQPVATRKDGFRLYLLLLLFARRSAAPALMVDLASDVGFRALFGLRA